VKLAVDNFLKGFLSISRNRPEITGKRTQSG